MEHMTIGDIKEAIKDLDDDLPVFFRRVPPVCGNIEELGQVVQDSYGFFGKSIPCVILEPMKEDEDEE